MCGRAANGPGLPDRWRHARGLASNCRKKRVSSDGGRRPALVGADFALTALCRVRGDGELFRRIDLSMMSPESATVSPVSATTPSPVQKTNSGQQFMRWSSVALQGAAVLLMVGCILALIETMRINEAEPSSIAIPGFFFLSGTAYIFACMCALPVIGMTIALIKMEKGNRGWRAYAISALTSSILLVFGPIAGLFIYGMASTAIELS